jgi:hypothetical protein
LYDIHQNDCEYSYLLNLDSHQIHINNNMAAGMCW